MNKICIVCGEDWFGANRHLKCGSCRYKNSKRPICQCGEIMTRGASCCRSCSGKKRTGVNNANWKNGVIHHGKGYILQYAPDHPRSKHNHKRYVFQHIIVMENYLGRYLLPNENIHHKNGQKDDNRIENLELWAKHQPSGQKVEDLLAWAHEIINLYGNKTF